MSQIPAAHQQRTKKEATDNRREGVTAEPPPCWAETWVVVIIVGPVGLVLFVVKLGVLVETLGRRVEAVAAGVSEAVECEKKEEEEEEVGETVVLIAVV